MNTAQVLTFEPATAPSTPSISASAMLVSLTIRVWAGRKLDRKASNEVTDNKNAKRGTANVHKKLLGNCPELDAIVSFAGAAREANYGYTMPWSDGGWRLLPTTAFFTAQREMTKLQAQFYDLVEAFLTAYQWEVGQAELRIGELFNAGDYPSASELRSKFSFDINYMPLPDNGDWRVDVDKEAKSVLTSHYESYYKKQFEAAMQSVWERAHDALQKMSERLDYTDDSKKVFRDTLVSNAQDVLELLRICNVAGDETMKAAQESLDKTLRGVTPDGLREDKHLRRRTKQAVDEIIANLPGLGM